MSTEIENNKLIADFMEYKQVQSETSSGIDYDWEFNGRPKFPYQKHWPCEYPPPFNEYCDWLMPCFRKFKDLDLNDRNYSAWVEALDTSIIDEYDITQAQKTLVLAIKWYNLQNQ